MLKRTLSFLLCLIMVLGLAAPSVQASGTGDLSSSSILDSIYIPEGSNGKVVINGQDVTDEVKNNTFSELPNLDELGGGVSAPSASTVTAVCDCADLASAVEHPGVCLVKAQYIELCGGTEEQLYAQWATLTPVEQSFMRQYLLEVFPLKLVALDKMLLAPSSSAIETLTDGTTVSVEGIPEYSSLTVADTTDEVKDIVDAYVSENETASTELFSYDVSIQDAEGAEWQPDVSVKMELELPGEKLHKYSKVYVVHVDDNGNATTIEAEVTEDGKIAFETPGFSAFFGFTVDFDYNGVQFSIPGMSSIKLSEVFENLKMPLYAENVVNVEYTDDTQLKIEKLEGDWLLTSLKAFTTDELLTLTMADGAVYQIKVTDDLAGQRADCYFATPGTLSNQCYLDVTYMSGESHNGVMTVMVSDNTGYGITTNDDKSSYYSINNWLSYAVIFDGNGVNNNFTDGGFEVCIQKNGTGDNFKVPVVNWYIHSNATVNVYLDGFDSNDTITLESWKKGIPMITVNNGTLYFNVDESVIPNDSSTDTGKIHNFHTTSCSYKELVLDGYNNAQINEDATVFVNDLGDNLYMNNVKFVNSGRRALYVLADHMLNCRLDNCTFDSTIYSTNGGGGAIYVSRYTSDGKTSVELDNFTLNNCKFDGNTVGATEKNEDGTPKVVRGGAVLVWGNLNSTTFYNCEFNGTHATAQGGAVSIGHKEETFNMGDITFDTCSFTGTYNDNSLAGAVLITQLSDDIKFENCTFTDITGAGHGGTIHIGATQDAGIQFQSFTMTGCTFTRCQALNGRGGVLRLYSSAATPVTITDCTFTECSASSLGGALSFQGIIGTLTISGTTANKNTFFNCQSTRERGGAISLDAKVEKCEISNASFTGCKSLGNRGGAIYHGGVTTDLDITNCTFTECETYIYGGAICLLGTTTTADITGGSFINCKAGTVAEAKNNDGTPVYDRLGNQLYNGNGGGSGICVAGKHGTLNIGGTSTTKQSYTNCESLNNGGAISFEGSCEIKTCNINYVYIDGCKARDSGTAILLGDVTIVNMGIKYSEIKNCTYISGRTGDAANQNSLYDEYYTEGMAYTDIIFRSNDSCGTIRTIGSCKAQLVVEEVDFTDNTSFTGGGGIYWNANRLNRYESEEQVPFTNSLYIKNCDFIGNKALRDGGAIYVEASLTVEGGTFKNNTAERGGAIAQQIYNNAGRQIQDGETNNLTLKGGAVFDENYARYHGGAISIRCNPTASIPATENIKYPITFTMDNATVKNNRAAENGGGVYFEQEHYDNADDQREVENYVKSCILNNATISGNYAGCGKDNLYDPANANGSGHGGGIFMEADKQVTLQILGSNIFSNTTHNGNGGGVYLTGADAKCEIKKNSDGITPVIGGASDKGNVATTTDPNSEAGQLNGNGGGIAIYGGGRIEMENGTVSYNRADTAGGGIAVRSSTMKVTNGNVTNNTSKYGGGISLANCGSVDSILNDKAISVWGMEFDEGTISDNVASGLGGGICLSGSSTMKLSGGDVLRNYAATATTGNSYSYVDGQHGGGIAVCQGSHMDIFAGSIQSNHARNGGGVAVQGGSALRMLPTPGSTEAGVVSNNQAHGYQTANQGCGGGIYLAAKAVGGNKNSLYINNGTISSNASRCGGGIAVYTGSEAELAGGSISSNTSTVHGGGAYVVGGKLTISGAEMYKNYGPSSGGAVYIEARYNTSEVSITDGNLHENYTNTGWGGAIYMIGQYGTTTVSGGKIYSNRVNGEGSRGGAINVEDGATLNVIGGEIYSNFSNGYGGGLHSYNNATINVKGGVIRNNTARIGGGGIALMNSSVATITTLEGGTSVGIITENTANNGGGIFVSEGADLTVIDGYITYNNATAPSTAGGLETGFEQNADLYGTGGGICVTNGVSASNTSTFTLKGDNMAIYGNMATFSADDVFSSGLYTQLDVPNVLQMNLAGYGFQPEGWFEDYNTADTYYLRGINAARVDESDDFESKRYRNAVGPERKRIDPLYVAGSLNGETVPDDEYFVNEINAYVAMTLGLPAAADDTVVIDFAGPVNIDLYKNDLCIDRSEYGADNSWLMEKLPEPDGVNVTNKNYVYSSKGNEPIGAHSQNLAGRTFANVYNGNSANNPGVITYAPRWSSLAFTQEDDFGYAVVHNNFCYYAKVTVIPATTLYMEDNADGTMNINGVVVSGPITYHNSGNLAPWTVGTARLPSQDQDRPGSLDDDLENLEIPDADNVYGYDSHYASTKTYSNGSASYVKLTPEKNIARASFTFTGTGFDIISLCNPNTTMVMVRVYEGKDNIYFDDDPSTTDVVDPTEPIVTYLVDTYYETDNTLYQVPVIKSDLTKVPTTVWDEEAQNYVTDFADYGYGTYTVEIYVSTSWFHDGNEFYLDAIRIYNPAGLPGTESQVIQDTYLADNEAWPVYQELRDMFISQSDYESLKNMTDEEAANIPAMEGILFIDGDTEPTIKDYVSFGPNNEVYLNPNQAIAFTMDLNNCTNVAGIQVGLRCLTGTGGKVNISSGGLPLQTLTKVGTTDMYYKIDLVDISGQVVVIENNGNKPIAITNIKVTHTSEPQYAQTPKMFMVNRRTAEIALDILSAEQLVESPVVTPKHPALSFNGMVCYNVFFSAENLGDLTADDLGLAVFSTEDTEGTIETAREVIYGATEIDGLYMTATGGVHAKYLGDKQYFRAFARKSDGTYVYSRMVSYSALDYAKNALAKSSDVKLKQLVVAMLNYGAEAQKFFGYKTDDLMNASLTADDQALLNGYAANSLNAVGKVDASKVGVFVSNRGFTDRKPAISFKGAFEINYFLTPAYTVDGDMKLYFWNEDTYNSVTELTAENADKVEVMTLENGIYAACSDEIAAKYLDKTVYVAAVYESDGVTYCSGVLPYSIAAYCQNPSDDVQELATAAAIYGCTAKEYFGV